MDRCAFDDFLSHERQLAARFVSPARHTNMEREDRSTVGSAARSTAGNWRLHGDSVEEWCNAGYAVFNSQIACYAATG